MSISPPIWTLNTISFWAFHQSQIAVISCCQAFIWVSKKFDVSCCTINNPFFIVILKEEKNKIWILNWCNNKIIISEANFLILRIYLGYMSMALLQNYWITNIVSIEKFLQTLTLISSWDNLPSNFVVNPLWLFIRCFCIALPIRKRIKNDTEVPW